MITDQPNLPKLISNPPFGCIENTDNQTNKNRNFRVTKFPSFGAREKQNLNSAITLNHLTGHSFSNRLSAFSGTKQERAAEEKQKGKENTILMRTNQVNRKTKIVRDPEENEMTSMSLTRRSRSSGESSSQRAKASSWP